MLLDKFKVPEPEVSFKVGFLGEFWQSQQSLPRMSTLEIVAYYAMRAIHNIVALPFSSAITMGSMAVSLFFLGGIVLLVQNIEQVITVSGSSHQISAYFKDNASQEKISEFLSHLAEDRRISSQQFVSQQEALTTLRNALGTKQSLLEGLAQDNPLPASVDLVVRSGPQGLSLVESVVQSLRESELIEEVDHGSEWVERTRGVLRLFRIFAAATLCVAFGIIIFLVANTIKLVIYARRDEISIMQLLGADDLTIRVPFVLSGLLQGLAGSVLGLGCLKLAFLLLNSQLRYSQWFGVVIPELLFLSSPVLCAVLLLGAAIGAIGSFFALGRFLDV